MKKLLLFSFLVLLFTLFSHPIAAQTGNVGIGTTNPQAKLHIAGDTRIDDKLQIKNSTGETIFRMDPENKTFEFLDADGSIFYRLAIEETSNLKGKGGGSNSKGIPFFPAYQIGTDPETGDLIEIKNSFDNGVLTTTEVVTEPNGRTTTTIDQGLDAPLLTLIKDPNDGSIVELHFNVDDQTGISKEVERFTDATGTTISVFENGILVSRKVFNKDGNKVIDFDGNTNTATPIGMETVSADGDEFYSDLFGNSLFDNNGNFAGLSINAISGLTSEGAFDVLGNLSKSSGTFKIDHPLDPTNKWLYHSFVESPDMMNVYNGNVTTDANGTATVELPEYFGVLNSDFRYQLTTIGVFAQAIISKKVKNNVFEIKTSEPNVEVSWQVTGIRQDDYAKDNRIEVEVEKTGWDKGKRRYDPNRKAPYSKGLQNHWERHVAKQRKREKGD